MYKSLEVLEIDNPANEDSFLEQGQSEIVEPQADCLFDPD